MARGTPVGLPLQSQGGAQGWPPLELGSYFPPFVTLWSPICSSAPPSHGECLPQHCSHRGWQLSTLWAGHWPTRVPGSPVR